LFRIGEVVVISQTSQLLVLRQMVQIQNNLFVVTGGASGLGKAVVLRLVECGGRVLILDIDEVGGLSMAKWQPDSICFPGKVDISQIM